MFSDSMWGNWFGGLLFIGVGIGVIAPLAVEGLGWGAWWLLQHLAWVR